MKIIAANTIPILFLALAGMFVYLNRDGWGWCLFCALCTAAYEKSTSEEHD